MAVAAPPSAVTAYAHQVVAGEIPAGKLIRLAAERHLRDLETGHERGIRFDAEAAELAIRFFHKLPHSKGEWAGRPIELRPWQAFIVGSIFGWMREYGSCMTCGAWLVFTDGLISCEGCFDPGTAAQEPAETGWYRRFRKAYNEVPRKNGKSTMSAGVGIKLAFFDDEPGAEVYAAATKRDQAKIVWGEARRMVKASPGLRQRVTALVANLHSEASNSKFEPLGADEDSMDGLNIHGVIIDELHAHKNRKTYDVLNTATGSRRQPLMFIITTAGFDRESICWQEHDYGVKVLERIIDDDSFFVFIATLDEDDDWTEPASWRKANPNWGVSVKPEIVKAAIEKAKQVPGEQNAVLRLHLDVWTEQAVRWLDMQAWDACGEKVDPSNLQKRECYGGLDLSTTTDLSSLTLVFPPSYDGEPYQVIWQHWVPKDNIALRARRDRVPYDVWAREGWIVPTEGNVVDYDVIRRDVNELAKVYNLRELAIDRWNSTQLQAQLMGDGINVAQFGQGFAMMTAPTKELERLVIERGIAHGGNPVARWAASNVTVEQDAAGNLKPSKKTSTERIDPIVSLIMALGRAIVSESSISKYESESLLVL